MLSVDVPDACVELQVRERNIDKLADLQSLVHFEVVRDAFEGLLEIKRRHPGKVSECFQQGLVAGELAKSDRHSNSSTKEGKR